MSESGGVVPGASGREHEAGIEAEQERVIRVDEHHGPIGYTRVRNDELARLMLAEAEVVRLRDARSEDEGCPKCGKPSASPPAEVYCVDCATEGWEKEVVS